jgi:mono/diheme cytochrome c family protein
MRPAVSRRLASSAGHRVVVAHGAGCHALGGGGASPKDAPAAARAHERAMHSWYCTTLVSALMLRVTGTARDRE